MNPYDFNVGSHVLHHAIVLRMRNGVNAAADWMEEVGIPRDLAVYALMHSGIAWHYGAPEVKNMGKWMK
jgi:hypothetical protein